MTLVALDTIDDGDAISWIIIAVGPDDNDGSDYDDRRLQAGEIIIPRRATLITRPVAPENVVRARPRLSTAE